MAFARVIKDRYLVVALVGLVAFISLVAVAFAYIHVTNGILHGLSSELTGHEYVPYSQTDPPGSAWSSAAVRHYFDDGTYNTPVREICLGAGGLLG